MAGLEPDHEAIAAVRCTREGTAEKSHEGTMVQGVTVDGKKLATVPITIPVRIPPDTWWDENPGWTLPRFRPASGLSSFSDEPIPNIRMDMVLKVLLGEALR